MDWSRIRWQMPLESPLTARAIAVGRHRPGMWPYRLPHLWCLHLFRDNAHLYIDGQSLPIRPGYASITPPNALLEYHFDRNLEYAYAHYSFPAGDDAATVSMPAMQDLGADFAMFDDLMREAVGYFPTQPRRGEARLTDVLWRLSDRTPDGLEDAVAGRHPVVLKVRRNIEQHLGEPLFVADLAAGAGVSHNHLTRLFQSEVGLPVVGYIRRRRVARARHLLIHSTLPIKAIASEVGLPDLQQFNKVIRRELGKSPRTVRFGE